jgi:hypothetical protein
LSIVSDDPRLSKIQLNAALAGIGEQFLNVTMQRYAGFLR